eukprot:COSAG03_NODE_2425_length_2785_cov_1.379747_3_plen_400_part_00
MQPRGPSAEEGSPARAAPRKFMLLIASNELVRTTKKVVATASTLHELSEHVMTELGLGLDAGVLTKPGTSAAVAVPIKALSEVKDKDKLMVWPRPRAAPASASAPAPAPAPVRVERTAEPAAGPRQFTLLLCKSELVPTTNRHFKTSAATLDELVGKVKEELETSETPVLCFQEAGGVRGAAVRKLDDLPAKAKVQVVSAAALNPDVMNAARGPSAATAKQAEHQAQVMQPAAPAGGAAAAAGFDLTSAAEPEPEGPAERAAAQKAAPAEVTQPASAAADEALKEEIAAALLQLHVSVGADVVREIYETVVRLPLHDQPYVLYLTAASQAGVLWNHSKLALIGDGRGGKTRFYLNISGQPVEGPVPSTIGVNHVKLSCVSLCTGEEAGKWVQHEQEVGA